MTSTFERYHDAASRLDALIDLTPTPADTSREAIRERAAYRMGRLRRFLARMGNPHEGYPIVHVGGTSGKGSTSTTIAAILTEAGFRTGLHTSPYLQASSEKLQTDGRLIAPGLFADLTDEILAEHDRWMAEGEAPLTYGEAWGALTWRFFTRERVEIAVVEVGAGGRFDLTNILTPVLSVITSVGIDHTHTLGSTIQDIAWHKAGIVKPGIPALSAVPHPVAREIIAREAAERRAPLLQVDLDDAIADITTSPAGTSWRERATGRVFRMGMCGSFQARNGYTAVEAIRLLRARGFAIDDDAIERGLLRAKIPGRAELIQDEVPVLLDGAHNAEKVAAIARDVPALLPARPGGRRVGVVGLLDAKQGDEMIRSIIPVIDTLIATAPKVHAKDAKAADKIADLARGNGFPGDVIVQPQPQWAIDHALRLSHKTRGDSILVTGSLYLVGNIRERWFQERDIVEKRSSWARNPVRTSIKA
jgi:dihydrofolate synthase / folylpolyglutamate synthase